MGVDIYRLAENMGTGVTQIRNHYGRHVSGDAFIQELTKYRSKSADRKKQAAAPNSSGLRALDASSITMPKYATLPFA